MLYNGSWVIKCCTATFGVKTIKVIDSVFRFDNERVRRKTQGRTQSQKRYMGNERSEKDGGRNKRISEKVRLYEGRTYTGGLRRIVSPTQYRLCKIKGRLRRLFRERTYEIRRRKKQKQNIIRKTRYSRLAEI